MNRRRTTPVLIDLGRPSLALCLIVAACTGQTFDAGSDIPHGLLAVDERNPVILTNDNQGDNWQGLYAVLFANAGGPPLAGIIVNATSFWPDINANLSGWKNMVSAARASGLRNLPDPIASPGSALVRPSNGAIDATVPNRSAGALLIVETSARLALPNRPLAVVTGGPLTDVADAYLIDQTVTDRVVIVSVLGAGSSKGGSMGGPNGPMDPWADWIVAQRFKYVQVSAYYDQTSDIPASQLSNLPQNTFGKFIAAQQPNLIDQVTASDQIGILAVGLPKFVTAVEKVSLDPSAVFDASDGPALIPDKNGKLSLVTSSDGAAASTRLWQMLQDPMTFSQ